MATRSDYQDHRRPKRTPPHAGLAAIRAMAGLTQDVLCERVSAITNKSFTKGALSAIELGHRGPSPETLRAIETALGLPTGSLVLDYEPSHARRSTKGDDDNTGVRVA